jgi:hypothetical protein
VASGDARAGGLPPGFSSDDCWLAHSTARSA